MKKFGHSHKKRKFSFESKENSNLLDIQRFISVRKMNRNEKRNMEIYKEINEFFSLPEKYFQKNSPVTVGKKIYLVDLDDPGVEKRKKKLKTERMTSVNIHNFQTYNRNENTNLNNENLTSKNNKNMSDLKEKFEVIDNEKLKKIFASYKTKSMKNKSLFFNSEPNFNMNSENFDEKQNQNLLTDNIPKNLKRNLFKQNKNLNWQLLNEKRNIKLARFLSKKLNKPLNNLLLNRIDIFRFKKEIVNEYENRKPIEEKYGKFKWNISLRRPSNFQGIRESYINLKDERFSPFWSIVVEQCPKQKNLCIKPGHMWNESDLNEVKKQNCSSNVTSRSQCYKTLENMEDLSVGGKNLYDIEYKREIIDSISKKILHKAFVENGKTILTSNINNLYGHNTFYKDYNNCVTEKSTKQNTRNYFQNRINYDLSC